MDGSIVCEEYINATGCLNTIPVNHNDYSPLGCDTA
jgi:hypothetical protein